MYIILRAKIWICPGTKVKKPHENWYQLFMYMTTNNQTHDQFISWARTAQSPCMHGLAALQPLLTDESVIATDAQSRDATSTLSTDLLQTQPCNHFRL